MLLFEIYAEQNFEFLELPLFGTLTLPTRAKKEKTAAKRTAPIVPMSSDLKAATPRRAAARSAAAWGTTPGEAPARRTARPGSSGRLAGVGK